MSDTAIEALNILGMYKMNAATMLSDGDQIALANVYAILALTEMVGQFKKAFEASMIKPGSKLCRSCGVRFMPKEARQVHHTRACANNAQHRERYKRRKEAAAKGDSS